ncbi:MAG: hypothetical protein ACYSU4_07750 [Planctomycetota bacterium]
MSIIRGLEMAFERLEISRREFMSCSSLAVTGMVAATASPVFSKSDTDMSSNRYHIDENRSRRPGRHRCNSIP